MDRTRIGFGTRVLVCDGRKALTLRNAADGERVSLEVVHVVEQTANPRTSDQGADRPGRAIDSASGARSAVAQTDWHDLTEREFVGDVAHALERDRRDGVFTRLVVVAPARALAELRRSFSRELRATIVAEIDKDLTGHTIPDIERHLARDL